MKISILVLFFRFAGAFLRSAWIKMRGFEVLSTTEVQNHRLSICDVCEFRSGDECLKCGCLTLSKAMLNAEKCPINKWDAVFVAQRRQNNDCL